MKDFESLDFSNIISHSAFSVLFPFIRKLKQKCPFNLSVTIVFKINKSLFNHENFKSNKV